MRRPAIVTAAAGISHLTALGGGFVWLDHAHIEDGAAIAPLGAVWRLFSEGFAGTGYYRPLMALSLSLDAAISPAPALFHVTNLLWHALASLATMLAAEALSVPRRAALVAGVLFAVHPLTSLVADAIAFRSEAMLTAALLILVYAHLRARPGLAAAAVLVAALTKETGFALAPLFVLALGRRDRKVLLAEAGAFAAALALRVAFAPPWRAAYASLSGGDAVGTRFASVAKSAAAVLAPIDRSICDAFPVTHLWQPTALAGGAALVALGVLAWKKRGIVLLLALSVLPALQLVPVTRWWSPHYLYVPFAFGAMLVAAQLERLDERRWKVAVFALGGVLGALSLSDGRRYADDRALWTREVQHQPACREAQFYLGEVERDAKRWDAAAKRYEAALAERHDILSYVDRGAALQNLGTVRFEQKRFGDARTAYREALAGTTDEQRRRELTHNLAGATLADGDKAEALRLLEAECARPDAIPASVALCAAARR